MNTITLVWNSLLLAALITAIGVSAGAWAGDPSIVEPSRRFYNDLTSVKWLADMVKGALGLGALFAGYVGFTDPASLDLVRLMWVVVLAFVHFRLTLRVAFLEARAKAGASEETPAKVQGRAKHTA